MQSTASAIVVLVLCVGVGVVRGRGRGAARTAIGASEAGSWGGGGGSGRERTKAVTETVTCCFSSGPSHESSLSEISIIEALTSSPWPKACWGCVESCPSAAALSKANMSKALGVLFLRHFWRGVCWLAPSHLKSHPVQEASDLANRVRCGIPGRPSRKAREFQRTDEILARIGQRPLQGPVPNDS